MTNPAVLQKRQIFAIAALAIPYYFMLLTDFGTRLGRERSGLNVTFNSMLDHLLQGRFDVDPTTVGLEGFTRDGHVFAYWGIVPALLRIPLLVFDDFSAMDVTAFSCLIATVLALVAKLWTLRIIARNTPNFPTWLVAAAVVALIFSGAQIGYLRASIYQEVCLWAGFFASVFVAATVQGVILRKFSAALLAIMALAAGLALLTRVSVAVGLFCAIGLLIIALIYRSPRKAFVTATPAFLILFISLIACGWINFQRWGNPLTFADYNFYNYNLIFPDRLERTHAIGLFNLARLPFGLSYFFVPLWFLHDRTGDLLFAGSQLRLMDAVELPPSSFLLTDCLLLGLSGFAICSNRVAMSSRLFGHQLRKNIEIVAITIGLLAPPLLMLTAISMNYRYRIDFYPLFEFGAFLGMIALARKQLSPNDAWRKAIWASVVTGVVTSHFSLALYRLSDFGPSAHYLQNGIIRYYGDQL